MNCSCWVRKVSWVRKFVYLCMYVYIHKNKLEKVVESTHTLKIKNHELEKIQHELEKVVELENVLCGSNT